MRPTAALLPLLVAACTTAPRDAHDRGSLEPGPGAEPEAQRTPEELAELTRAAPWTDAFRERAILMADVLRIEGPRGLREHLVVGSDDALYQREAETLPEGFRQVTRLRSPVEGALAVTELVRGQLDGWQLAALRSIEVLERPDDAATVVVTAAGDAVWRDTDGEERRGEQLVFRGEIGAAGDPAAAREAAAGPEK